MILKDKLDKIFSLYIRQRDSVDGVGRCVTCGTYGEWKGWDCGHFISRACLSTRWDEKNCALQCKRCNGFRGGEQHLFAKAIDKKYGDGASDELQMKRHLTVKMSKFDYETRIQYFKEKIEQL